MEFRTAYGFRGEHPGLVFSEPSMTKQSFKDECDINVILARYENTGMYYDPLTTRGSRAPLFDDFTAVPDYMDAQNFVIEAGEMFDALPSRIRKRFNNSPAQLLEFLADSANVSEAIGLGLISAPVEQPEPQSKPEPQAKPEPSPGNPAV